MNPSIHRRISLVASATLLTFVTASSAFAQTPHDMSTMSGMDHSQIQTMEPMLGMEPSTGLRAPTQSRTPIPVLTEADRKAAFFDSPGHMIHDKSINSFFLVDRLEWQDAKNGNAFNWDFKGWIGGDIDRLWLRSEGEREKGRLKEAEVEALWGHSISPWWDLVGGLRQDFKPGSPQTWGAFGIQGLALYNFDAEATFYVGERGQTAARLKGEYDILMTNRLILQPTAEVNFYGKNDKDRGVGSGLSTTKLGVRLRYELRREFAPYVGVTWNRAYGSTADYARAHDESRNEIRVLAGVRIWF